VAEREHEQDLPPAAWKVTGGDQAATIGAVEQFLQAGVDNLRKEPP
jgi:hypothetical protein